MIFSLFFSACTSQKQFQDTQSAPAGTPATRISNTPSPQLSMTSTPEEVPTATSTPSPTPPPGVWLAAYLPETFVTNLQIPKGFNRVNDPSQAQIKVDVGNGVPIARWVYALVAPFPTIEDEMAYKDLLACWQRGAAADASADMTCTGFPLLLDETTRAIFVTLWGEPATDAVRVLAKDQLLGEAWNMRSVQAKQSGQEVRSSWAIVPFEALVPQWKVIQLDGQNPLGKDFIAENYPLTVTISLDGAQEQVEPFIEQLHNNLAQTQDQPGNPAQASNTASGLLPAAWISNRDPGKLTTVMLTGVTALVRATAETMRRNDNTYPARFLAPVLQFADILHISNEIPFAEKCPQPNPHQTDLHFCSRPEYIELLEYIGTDVVELSGDHFADWGAEAMRFTLNMYRERNIPYYGGGENLEDGRKAYLTEHNGNKIAFLGCNAKGGGYATASETNPGAVACDPEWLRLEIARLRAQGYNVIVTFQHDEYYTYTAQPGQVADFRAMAEAGATIISGSQAHQPQGMEFYPDVFHPQAAFIHYGLGNLFFDQYFMGLPTSQAFLDRHVFYDNRHISTELIGIYFIDFASARLMTPEERRVLLEAVFEASGW